MENKVPSTLKGKNLSVDEYCSNLEHFARNEIQRVTFTGGEPTLNPFLPEIISVARRIFSRVELTTNGFKLPDLLSQLAPNLDIIKISLDATDNEMVQKITGGNVNALSDSIIAIREACIAGLKVGINVVVTRSNLDQIQSIIELCKKMNMQGSGSVYISLLDLYYSRDKHDFWEEEFIPIDYLGHRFSTLYGPPVTQKKFGCCFFWFNVDGVNVRFKNSTSATLRTDKCNNCSNYCQEGIFCLQHSVEGWVTTCPTGDPKHGVYLSPGLNSYEVNNRLSGLLTDIKVAKPDQNSFQSMLRAYNLHPQYVKNLKVEHLQRILK